LLGARNIFILYAYAMNSEPLTAALQAVTETRRLLQSLLISSENFRYKEAKAALTALERKVRELGKLQARLEKGERRRITHPPNVCVVDFRKSPAKDSRAY
jgi:hypothetical protein